MVTTDLISSLYPPRTLCPTIGLALLNLDVVRFPCVPTNACTHIDTATNKPCPVEASHVLRILWGVCGLDPDLGFFTSFIAS